MHWTEELRSLKKSVVEGFLNHVILMCFRLCYKMKSSLILFLTVGGFIGLFALGGISSFLSDSTANNSPNSILGNQIEAEPTNTQVVQPIKASPTAVPKAVKASDKSLKLATYIFAVIDSNQRAEFIEKFSNGENDLALAVNNLALTLDNKPELLVLVEKAVAQDPAQRATKTTEDDNTSIFSGLDYPDPIPNSGVNTYGNTNSYNNYQAPSNSSNNYSYTRPKPTPTPDPTINVYGNADSYTRYGNTVYGSDGSSYTQYGNTVYGNDGSSYTKYGNTIYGNDGSTSTKYGNTTYGSDGTSYTQYGNTTYGSDGSGYTQYGNTVYTEPGY